MALSWWSYGVFSTSVEVFLLPVWSRRWVWGLLHVRGGVSTWYVSLGIHLESSPRPWRCFHRKPIILQLSAVFSTSVEVFL